MELISSWLTFLATPINLRAKDEQGNTNSTSKTLDTQLNKE